MPHLRAPRWRQSVDANGDAVFWLDESVREIRSFLPGGPTTWAAMTDSEKDEAADQVSALIRTWRDAEWDGNRRPPLERNVRAFVEDILDEASDLADELILNGD